MRTRVFSIGDTVRLATRRIVVRPDQDDVSGIVVRKIVTETTGTEIYEVLLSDGRLVSKLPDQLRHVVIRRDGAEVNV